MEKSLAATPTNVQVDSTKDNSMQSKEMDEMQMSVAHMPANARDSESDRAETLSEPEGGTAEWNLRSGWRTSRVVRNCWTRCWRK